MTKFFSVFFFSPTIPFDTTAKKAQKCQFLLRSECIWGMLKPADRYSRQYFPLVVFLVVVVDG